MRITTTLGRLWGHENPTITSVGTLAGVAALPVLPTGQLPPHHGHGARTSPLRRLRRTLPVHRLRRQRPRLQLRHGRRPRYSAALPFGALTAWMTEGREREVPGRAGSRPDNWRCTVLSETALRDSFVVRPRQARAAVTNFDANGAHRIASSRGPACSASRTGPHRRVGGTSWGR
jgi:hypothetical protein